MITCFTVWMAKFKHSNIPDSLYAGAILLDSIGIVYTADTIIKIFGTCP